MSQFHNPDKGSQPEDVLEERIKQAKDVAEGLRKNAKAALEGNTEADKMRGQSEVEKSSDFETALIQAKNASQVLKKYITVDHGVRCDYMRSLVLVATAANGLNKAELVSSTLIKFLKIAKLLESGQQGTWVKELKKVLREVGSEVKDFVSKEMVGIVNAINSKDDPPTVPELAFVYLLRFGESALLESLRLGSRQEELFCLRSLEQLGEIDKDRTMEHGTLGGLQAAFLGVLANNQSLQGNQDTALATLGRSKEGCIVDSVHNPLTIDFYRMSARVYSRCEGPLLNKALEDYKVLMEPLHNYQGQWEADERIAGTYLDRKGHIAPVMQKTKVLYNKALVRFRVGGNEADLAKNDIESIEKDVVEDGKLNSIEVQRYKALVMLEVLQVIQASREARKDDSWGKVISIAGEALKHIQMYEAKGQTRETLDIFMNSLVEASFKNFLNPKVLAEVGIPFAKEFYLGKEYSKNLDPIRLWSKLAIAAEYAREGSKAVDENTVSISLKHLLKEGAKFARRSAKDRYRLRYAYASVLLERRSYDSVLVDSGNVTGATKALEKAVNYSYWDDLSFLERGDHYSQIVSLKTKDGDFDSAIKYLENAIIEYKKGRATVLEERKRLELIPNMYSRLLELAQHLLNGQNTKLDTLEGEDHGRCLENIRGYEAKLRDYKEALEEYAKPA